MRNPYEKPTHSVAVYLGMGMAGLVIITGIIHDVLLRG